jgi:hypothetical protein
LTVVLKCACIEHASAPLVLMAQMPSVDVENREKTSPAQGMKHVYSYLTVSDLKFPATEID